MGKREQRVKRQAHREAAKGGWTGDKHIVKKGGWYQMSPKLSEFLKYVGIGILLTGLALLLVGYFNLV